MSVFFFPSSLVAASIEIDVSGKASPRSKRALGSCETRRKFRERFHETKPQAGPVTFFFSFFLFPQIFIYMVTQNSSHQRASWTQCCPQVWPMGVLCRWACVVYPLILPILIPIPGMRKEDRMIKRAVIASIQTSLWYPGDHHCLPTPLWVSLEISSLPLTPPRAEP